MVITDTEMSILEIQQNSGMSLDEMIRAETNEWLNSEERKWILDGNAYYKGKTNILNNKPRLANRSNVKKVHAFIRKLTDKKTGYLLSFSPSFKAGDNESYQDCIDRAFNKDFLKLLKNTGKDAITCGKSWWEPRFNPDGTFKFRRHKPWEIKPLWANDEHSELFGFLRVFEREEYISRKKKVVRYVDYTDSKRIRHYKYPDRGTGLQFLGEETHFKIGDMLAAWNKVPLICWKYNEEEQGLTELVISQIEDLDIDCNTLETEFQSSFEQVEWFFKNALKLMGKGDFLAENMEVSFNRNIIVNEKEIIEMCQASRDIVSDETILAHHPWVEDVAGELELLKKQKKKNIDN